MARKQDRWEEVLRHLGRDVSKPLNLLTAEDIKIATRALGAQEEPRLMASMDSERALPDFFRRNGVFLLPLARGNYALVHGNGFHELEPPQAEETFPVRLPLDLTTLTYGTGESRYLLHAFHSGLISHFSGVSPLYQTILGKMGTVDFSFRVRDSSDLRVEGAGMEVDMGFEGPNDILLFEAKVQPRATFLVRQLYYPYRTFSTVTKKIVRPVFFVAEPAANAYTLWEYEWTRPDDYEAIRPKKSVRFQLVESPLPVEPLEQIEPDPSLLIVPQADNFPLVEELPALVQEGVTDAKKWAKAKDYDVRQGYYYGQAAEALGLIKRERAETLTAQKFLLTEAGRRLLATPPDKKNGLLAGLLLRNPVMNAVFHLALESGGHGVAASDLQALIEANSGLTSATPPRRAQTIRAYFRWLSQATGAVVVEGGIIYSREGWDERAHNSAATLP